MKRKKHYSDEELKQMARRLAHHIAEHSNVGIGFMLSIEQCYILLAHLGLALAHPENHGPGSLLMVDVREMVLGALRKVSAEMADIIEMTTVERVMPLFERN